MADIAVLAYTGSQAVFTDFPSNCNYSIAVDPFFAQFRQSHLPQNKQIPLPQFQEGKVPERYDEEQGIWHYQKIPSNCNLSNVRLTQQVITELNLDKYFNPKL